MQLKLSPPTLLLALLLALGLQLGTHAQQTNASSTPVIARKVAPNDVLLIRVLGEPDMTAEKKVTAEGKIDYFFIGEIDLTGKSVSEAQKIIRDKLDADYLVDPQVYVEVKVAAEQYVTVTGQVFRAGRVLIPADHEMDILEAIGAAGDFNPKAKKNQIELRRKGKITRHSYDELKKPENRIVVEPEDMIDVAERVF